MEFNAPHVYGGASLADWYWVTGAILWGVLLAKLALLAIWTTGTMRLAALLGLTAALLLSRLGTHLLANLLQAPASNSYSWGPHWIALPVGAVILAFRVAQPAIDHFLSMARAISALNCVHAIWAMTWYPEELFLVVEPDTRPGFEVILASVPIVAVSGVLALIALQLSIGDSGRAGGWRPWLSARLQLAVSALTLLLQMDLLAVAAFPSLLDQLFPVGTFFKTFGTLLALMAAARFRALRLRRSRIDAR